jgi:hypothetical protein
MKIDDGKADIKVLVKNGLEASCVPAASSQSSMTRVPKMLPEQRSVFVCNYVL